MTGLLWDVAAVLGIIWGGALILFAVLLLLLEVVDSLKASCHITPRLHVVSPAVMQEHKAASDLGYSNVFPFAKRSAHDVSASGRMTQGVSLEHHR